MKSVTSILDSTTRTQPGSQVPRDDKTAILVNRIFKRLTHQCTAWKQAVDGDLDSYANEYKRILLEGLVRERINDMEKIKVALEQVDTDFLPNPERFIKLCKGGEDITGTWGTAAHRIFDKSKLLPEGTEEGRQEAGSKALTDMKGMFE